ncbi:hypothetical protein Q6A88_07900 [Aliarcobacter skirrowii]|uniref:hypothetical protein n=1 Tax=Aliarcobacter skirrowii TaxID=28200 RepID=UPI0029A77284|nr:hypothetical protein [Aliarcobacter skirrowii]MDX4071622.1 hypothetical protein [Aliarcobacter skirrowii]
MRNIKIILTNDVDNNKFDEQIFEIYRFDTNKDDLEKLNQIVIDINKSQNQIVSLITNKKDLFESFNRNIIFEKVICSESGLNDNFLEDDLNPEIKNENVEFKMNLENNFDFMYKQYEEIKYIFFNNINEVLFKYGDIFQIDIEQLVKGTTYNVNNRDDLSNLLVEDLNLINFKGIVTSRLCVVFYRLTYFDLDASKASIGRFFANHFEKSESFKMNLNRNPNGWFFTDLNNKIFRGYRIKPLKLEISDIILNLKIKIAKKLLSNGVKLKVVAESLEMEENKLKSIIYPDINHNPIW